MSEPAQLLPAHKELVPQNTEQLAQIIRRAAESGQAVYPWGGGTKQHWGLPPQKPGVVLRTSELNRVVEYPWEDMTITVQAGITVAQLQRQLTLHGQHLPVDVPGADRATVGGSLAVAISGPRRLGYGSWRDYVLGVEAVDCLGRVFHGGGRVVKNVAGYDFCKLLTGSWGRVGVVTQVTLKVPPRPPARAILVRALASWQQAEEVLQELNTSVVQPVAVELVAGSAREQLELPKFSSPAVATLIVVLEGTTEEVQWMSQELGRNWESQAAEQVSLPPEQQEPLWSRLVDFPLVRHGPATIQATLLPSHVVGYVQQLLAHVPEASVVAHAGTGGVLAHLQGLAPGEVSGLVIRHLQPLAQEGQGTAVVLCCQEGVERTAQLHWDGSPPGAELMRKVIRAFDPQGVLNPGRFVV